MFNYSFILSKLQGTRGEYILNHIHNSITKIEQEPKDLWLHRKGVSSSDQGVVIIPGTRGTLTYLAIPTGDQDGAAWSLAHGAGRKWNRKSVKGRLKTKYSAKSLSRTQLGGLVICEDKELLYQEAPQAYKKIDDVIGEMAADGLIRLIASFRPVITYKVRKTK
ncbi:RtcB family protein [Desulfococcaceae bacterium HSG7]|nr:RtcB family protein [Desulfococcaceae bacterium HSG7]